MTTVDTVTTVTTSTHGDHLVEYLDNSNDDSASVCDMMILVCFEKFVFDDRQPSLL
jgi:hypothetical protein